MNDYEERCYRAAEGQGLSTPLTRLAGAGYSVTVDQTGGFCMCLRVNATQVPAENRRGIPDTAYVWVTNESPTHADDEYLVCLYDSADEETDGQLSIRDQVCEGVYLAETVGAFLTGRPSWNCHVQSWVYPDGSRLDADQCEQAGIDSTLRDR